MEEPDLESWFDSRNRLYCSACGQDYRVLPPWARDEKQDACEQCGQRPALDPFRARLAELRREVARQDAPDYAGPRTEASVPWRDVLYTLPTLDDELKLVHETIEEIAHYREKWIAWRGAWATESAGKEIFSDPESQANFATEQEWLVCEREELARRIERAHQSLHDMYATLVPLGWSAGVGPEPDVTPPPVPQPSVTIAEHWNVITRRKFFWDIRKLNLVPADPDDNWQYRLRVAQGVYLIRDLRTGVQYVGAAYGENGLWRCFKEYIKTNGHGENKRLIEYVNTHPDHALHVKVLHWASTSRPDLQEILDQENHWKFVLGTREGPLGLNAN
jgi:hypothetical protein